MKDIIKRISVVTAIMFITLGGCVTCASNEDWWLCLIPAAIGVLILLSIYIAEMIENKRHNQKEKIILDGRYIRIDCNNHSYRIINTPSDFDIVLDELKDKQQEGNNGKV